MSIIILANYNHYAAFPLAQFPVGTGGDGPLPKFGRVEYRSFYPSPKIYSYRKTLRQFRFCEQPTEMLSKDVRECDRELLYFILLK